MGNPQLRTHTVSRRLQFGERHSIRGEGEDTQDFHSLCRARRTFLGDRSYLGDRPQVRSEKKGHCELSWGELGDPNIIPCDWWGASRPRGSQGWQQELGHSGP